MRTEVIDRPGGDVPVPTAVGQVVAGRFERLGLLGRGGQASVYRARDRLLGREVALKVFDPTSDLAGADRVRHEMLALAALEHPGIVTVYDVGSTDGCPYLVMRLVDRGSLTELLAGGPLPPGQAAVLTASLCEAVRYVHARGLVHGDIKPANVLLATDPGGDGLVPLLADFGTVSVPVGTPGTSEDGLVGTPAYLAPEQVAGEPDVAVGPAVDVYALGLVVLEALTGRREFTGPAGEAAVERLHRDPVVPDDLPGDLRALLTSMTARDPRRRPTPARAADAARRVATRDGDTVSSTDLVLTGRAPSRPTEPRRVGRRRTLVAGTAAVGLAGVVVAVSMSGVAAPGPAPAVVAPPAPSPSTAPRPAVTPSATPPVVAPPTVLPAPPTVLPAPPGALSEPPATRGRHAAGSGRRGPGSRRHG